RLAFLARERGRREMSVFLLVSEKRQAQGLKVLSARLAPMLAKRRPADGGNQKRDGTARRHQQHAGRDPRHLETASGFRDDRRGSRLRPATRATASIDSGESVFELAAALAGHEEAHGLLPPPKAVNVGKNRAARSHPTTIVILQES